jgi:hypothetical protein
MGLVDEIETTLRRRGSIQTTVASDGEADEWRKAARAAARKIGRPVETVQHRHVVVALKDWPANELEQQLWDATLNNVMSRIPNLSK